MINEDAPTMSAGTGGFSGSSAANGPVAGFDSMMGAGKLTKKKPKRRKYVKEEVSVDLEQKTAMALPFRVSYKDEAMDFILYGNCLLYTSPSPRDRQKSRMPSSA